MAKVDDGFRQSEKMLNELEAKIHREYARATADMTEKVNDYFSRFKKKDEENYERYINGEISKREYTEWRQRQMITGKRYIAMRDTLARDLTNTDRIAMKMVNQSLPDVYALNMNYGTYSIEKDSKINTSFTLYNHAAVERLIKENPQLLPNPKVDIPKDLRWNKQHINSAITQGILQGKSISKIAKDLQNVTGMDERAAIRNARTAMTGAQNAGRFDSMKRAAARGVGLKKGWMATLDHVTRDSHVDLDGEVQELDKPFSNGLMYPGGIGEPAEVYNCFIPETKIGVDSKIIRSYKHRYEGEIISIKSALGVNLSCTPNHPILTDRGWVAAKFLNEGDNLIVTSCIDNEVSRRNPNINHAFPRIDTIHQLFDIFGGKRTSDLRVNFHGDIPTSEVEIITQKRFLWSDVYTCIRKCINKFLFKDTNISFLCKCSFVEHFRRIMRTTFGNVSGVCKSFSFFLRSMEHSDIHGLRAITDGNVVFGKDTLNDLPTNVVLPSEIKNGLARKVFLDNIVSVERSDFVGHVYNLQTDNNYYFVNSSITNNNAHCNDIMAIAHNCRCRLTHEYDKYKTDWSNPANRNISKLGNMSYAAWKAMHTSKMVPKTATNEDASNKVKESLNYIENRDSKLSYEKGAIIGANGDILKEYDGTEHAVEVTNEDLQLMQGMTFTHNHPNGGFFSDNDIKTGFIKTHLGELRASTPQGIVYVLKDNNATLEDAQKYLAEYSQTSMRARRTAQEHFIRMIKSGDLSKDYYDKHYFELLQQYRDEKLIAMTKEKAKDFNLIFEVQKIEK